MRDECAQALGARAAERSAICGQGSSGRAEHDTARAATAATAIAILARVGGAWLAGWRGPSATSAA